MVLVSFKGGTLVSLVFGVGTFLVLSSFKGDILVPTITLSSGLPWNVPAFVLIMGPDDGMNASSTDLVADATRIIPAAIPAAAKPKDKALADTTSNTALALETTAVAFKTVYISFNPLTI